MFIKTVQKWNIDDNLGIVTKYNTKFGNCIYVAEISAGVDSLFNAMSESSGRPTYKRPSEIGKEYDAAIGINATYPPFWDTASKKYAVSTLISTTPDGTVRAHFPKETTARKGRSALVIYNSGKFDMIPDNQIIGGSWASTQKNVAKLLDDGVRMAVSFAPTLIQNGALVQIPSSFLTDGKQPRTAIAQKTNTSWLFVVSDAPGNTMLEWQEVMKSLDVAHAYNLDGGGSCSMYLRNVGVINRPSGGSERQTGDTIFFKAQKKEGVPVKPNASSLMKWLPQQLGCGYVYGTIGQECTIALLKGRESAYGKSMGVGYYHLNGDYTKGRCAKWIGKIVYDCSGLIKASRKNFTGAMKDENAQMMYTGASKKGERKTMPLQPGVAVFMYSATSKKMAHVGVYVGNGKVIEARGVDHGVVETTLQSRAWTHWAYMDWLDYDMPLEKGTAGTSTGDVDMGDAEKPVAPTSSVTYLGYCSANSVNIRSGAGTTFPVIGVSKKDEELYCVDQKNGWVHIAKLDGDKLLLGYMSDKYAKKK